VISLFQGLQHQPSWREWGFETASVNINAQRRSSIAFRRYLKGNKFMSVNLLDQVRCSCKAVTAKSAYIQIDTDIIPQYAKSIPIHQAIAPAHDPRTHYLNHGEDTAAFFVILDTINFGSGYFPHLVKGRGRSGYFTVASSLNNYFKHHGPMSAEQLKRLTAAECTTIFNQTPDSHPIQELMQLFAAALNTLGRYLIDRFNGSFTGLISAAENSAERLAGLLIQMPFFNDAQTYDGMKIHFYKRAQLAAADLSLAMGGEDLGFFKDLSDLTIFADNLVPHVLRMDGILQYDKNLAARIDNEQLIPSGSNEEIEIRACAVHAVELIAAELQKKGRKVTSQGLDYLLWNRGQQPYYKKTKPRHRTRTVYY
jgi:hypothetical protein